MKKKTHRKYTSKQHPVQLAIECASIITPQRNNEYRKRERSMLDRMAQGAFDDDTWHEALYMVNQSELMACVGIGPEVLEPVRRAQVSLARMRARRTPDCAWRADPGEVYELREVQEYHDLQRQSIPYGQYREFIKKTVNKTRTGSLPNYEQILEAHDANPTPTV
jgi:hypothetical protein